MLFQCGQVVRSHAGRDKGHILQPTLDVIEMIKERIEKNEHLMNSEVRRHLIPFQIPETQ